ncbi:hypothetical protein Gotri_012802 [Gossypium trilobum]|uniref:Uncharacterized protein n=1 Tax=Gossypium trilobum TaxID=34281 RepID=A0A7J9DS17_9ROSI|nr:hypothetical protein [Gossypium trilobum]
MKNLAIFFKWFYPLEQWIDMIMNEQLKDTRALYIVIIFLQASNYSNRYMASMRYISTMGHKD